MLEYVEEDGSLTLEATNLLRITMNTGGGTAAERAIRDDILRQCYDRVNGRLSTFCERTGITPRRASEMIRRIMASPSSLPIPAHAGEYTQVQYAPSSDLQLAADGLINLAIRSIDMIHERLDLNDVDTAQLIQLMNSTLKIATMIRGVMIAGKDGDAPAKTAEVVREKILQLQNRIGLKKQANLPEVAQ